MVTSFLDLPIVVGRSPFFAREGAGQVPPPTACPSLSWNQPGPRASQAPPAPGCGPALKGNRPRPLRASWNPSRAVPPGPPLADAGDSRTFPTSSRPPSGAGGGGGEDCRGALAPPPPQARSPPPPRPLRPTPAAASRAARSPRSRSLPPSFSLPAFPVLPQWRVGGSRPVSSFLLGATPPPIKHPSPHLGSPDRPLPPWAGVL